MDTSAIEYKICELLSMLNDESTKGFWCDGVALCENESHYTKKYVNDHRFIKLKAYIGKTGQTEYCVKLKFGRKALSRYARDLSIMECFPFENIKDAVNIDVVGKILEIQLM